MTRLFARILTVMLVAFLAMTPVACSTSGSAERKTQEEKPVEKLYAEARQAFDRKEYKTAARLFDEVERQHPYSAWATQANMMSAYSSYQAEDYVMAIGTLDRFIDMHPGNKDIAYAYYLRAICYYEQIVDVGRDQDLTRKATEALEDVMRRFPDTPYARDAKFKRDLTWDHLAGKEMEIGRFYLKRHFYQAAINRFKAVLETYQTTTHTPEALHRLVEAYTALGLTDEANRMAAVLGHNYPGSDWYEASYALLKKGKTLQIGNRGEGNAAPTTAAKLKNTVMGLFE